MELSTDPLDKPFVAPRKGAGYTSYEGCMEGKSLILDKTRIEADHQVEWAMKLNQRLTTSALRKRITTLTELATYSTLVSIFDLRTLELCLPVLES
jgi:hypothetical protein